MYVLLTGCLAWGLLRLMLFALCRHGELDVPQKRCRRCLWQSETTVTARSPGKLSQYIRHALFIIWTLPKPHVCAHVCVVQDVVLKRGHWCDSCFIQTARGDGDSSSRHRQRWHPVIWRHVCMCVHMCWYISRKVTVCPKRSAGGSDALLLPPSKHSHSRPISLPHYLWVGFLHFHIQ